MGHNVDLEFMLGAPGETKCPHCGKKTKTFFCDYDIDCGEPNPQPGVWCLSVTCQHCDEEIDYERTVKLSKTKTAQ